NIGVIPFKQDNVSINSLPLKMFEYMACGVPIISTYVDAIRENFGQTVRFVSNADDYTREIMELYQDPHLCNRLGLEGRHIVEDKYQWATLAKKLDTILVAARSQE
ncbi:MAG: glycosyltransferase, partial [Candidatus Cloacimonetes bacterium]|nr:glycosyltransferase [Candidatus Cloacimonadota bacterium]